MIYQKYKIYNPLKNFYVKIFLLIIISNFNQVILSQNIQSKIGQINFTGNTYYSDEVIKNMLVSKPGNLYSTQQFEIDLQNVIKNYQKEGFINCSIENIENKYSSDSSAIELAFSIQEGSRVPIGEIIIEGNRKIPTKELIKNFFSKIGNYLEVDVLNQDINNIIDLYEKKGFIFTSVVLNQISTYIKNGKENLLIHIIISEKQRVKIDKLSIEGNTITNEKVVIRESNLNKNGFVTRDDLIEFKARLDNTGYFENVDVPKIYKYKNSTVLKIKLKEGNSNTFDGIVGYIPPTANEDNGYFTGDVKILLKNLFGTGRRIDARWQKLQKLTQELELKYEEPWLFNLPLNLSFGFLQRVQDSTYVKRNIGSKADIKITKLVTGGLLLYYERVIPSESYITNPSGAYYTVYDSRLISAGIELKIDTRDYVYNPTKGILYKASYSAGQKKIYNTQNLAIKDVQPYMWIQKIYGDLEFYYSLFSRQCFLIGAHATGISASGLENSDYFRLGGIKTVRGYSEEQFLANRAIWSNIEFRYSITRKTFASAFFDIGYYKRKADEITKLPEENGNIYGYGLGIRIETPLGIMGFSYALGKGDNIMEGKVHFGLVNDF
jgi:outer membrane protein insertion porin family